MGNHLGKTLKDEDACDEDLVIKNADDLKLPMNEQEICSDSKPKKSQLAGSTIPTKQVKEDFITEEAVKTNDALFNMIIGCIVMLLLIPGIKSFFSDIAAKVSTKYKSYLMRTAVSPVKLFLNLRGEQMRENFVRHLRYAFSLDKYDTEEVLCLLIIVCIGFIVMLGLVIIIISVSSANSRSSSPRFDATSSRSSTDGQTNSNISPTPVSPGKAHQVFFNFRGEQVRKNFVSHLCAAFQRHNIKFFIDKKELRGNKLQNLFVRIEESSIALAIFSTRYTESSWCLDELVKMKELVDKEKLRVIPIFFKVNPEDVRNPTRNSKFGKNLWRLAQANVDKIKAWIEALESISVQTGLCLEESDEADFVNDIVNEVEKVIKDIIRLKEGKENHDGIVKDGPFDG